MAYVGPYSFRGFTYVFWPAKSEYPFRENWGKIVTSNLIVYNGITLNLLQILTFFKNRFISDIKTKKIHFEKLKSIK